MGYGRREMHAIEFISRVHSPILFILFIFFFFFVFYLGLVQTVGS